MALIYSFFLLCCSKKFWACSFITEGGGHQADHRRCSDALGAATGLCAWDERPDPGATLLHSNHSNHLINFKVIQMSVTLVVWCPLVLDVNILLWFIMFCCLLSKCTSFIENRQPLSQIKRAIFQVFGPRSDTKILQLGIFSDFENLCRCVLYRMANHWELGLRWFQGQRDCD